MIAYVTSAPALELQETDLALVLQAAVDRDVAVEVVRWDDPGVDWTRFDHAVVRSCWDYVARRSEFLDWADHVHDLHGPRLHNTAAVLRWNTDKTYLRELSAAGVPVIETHWDVASIDDLHTPHPEWVVKPTISAGSRDTARWATPDEAVLHSRQLLDDGRATMTQPYIASVDDEGETAMLFFGGQFSHAVRKGPLLAKGEGVNNERDGRGVNRVRVPTERQQQVARQAIDAAQQLTGSTFLYARVDLVTGQNGEPVVIELELTEPYFFLDLVPEAATNLVRALEALS